MADFIKKTNGGAIPLRLPMEDEGSNEVIEIVKRD